MMAQLSSSQLAPFRAAAPPYTGSGYNIDYNYPIYYSVPTDPEYTLWCYFQGTWGDCPLNGTTIHIPNAAYPEQSGGAYAAGPGNSDHHMTVIDSETGTQYDMYQASPPNGSGGDFTIGWGSSESLTGQGITTFQATRSGFAASAAVVRAPDLQAGSISHALRFVVPCANDYPGNVSDGTGVYPAAVSSDRYCTGTGYQPYYGMRIQLTMSASQIAALPVSAYVKTILTALATYGAYMTDTGSGNQGSGEFDLVAESGLTYVQVGLANPWLCLATQFGVSASGTPPNNTYSFPMMLAGVGIGNIGSYLRVIAPCVTTHACTY